MLERRGNVAAEARRSKACPGATRQTEARGINHSQSLGPVLTEGSFDWAGVTCWGMLTATSLQKR